MSDSNKLIKFSNSYKKLNIFSFLLIIFSLLILLLKGLNFGVDFKGGTLIEIRTVDSVRISDLRDAFVNMNLGDVTVKKEYR
jgi:preprotein translocase subunit SecF